MENLSVYAFVATMLVCIYLAIVAQNMEKGQVVWACSVSLFVVLLLQVAVLFFKGIAK